MFFRQLTFDKTVWYLDYGDQSGGNLMKVFDLEILHCVVGLFFYFQVLFVSPERLLNPEFLSMFRMSLSVSLVVVDEAHCVSEW